MRLMLLLALFLSACAHARAPSIPEQARVTGLLGDDTSVGQAAETSRKWPQRMRRDLALVAYHHHFAKKRWEAAAAIAWHFRLGERYAHLAMTFAAEAKDMEAAVRIACAYGASPGERDAIVDDAVMGTRVLTYRGVMASYDAGCPLTEDQATIVMEAAFDKKRPDAIVGILLKQNRPRRDRVHALRALFFGQCREGIRAMLPLAIDEEDVAEIVRGSDCEVGILVSPPSFMLPPRQVLMAVFHEAVRWKKYLLALAVAESAGLKESEAYAFVIEKAFLLGGEMELSTLASFIPKLQTAMLGHAIAIGRTRFVTNITKDKAWIRRAFEAAMDAGKYEDAGEIAEWNGDPQLAKQGALEAMRAAIGWGKFDRARALRDRYRIPHRDYDAAMREHYSASSPVSRPRTAPAPQPTKKRHIPCPADSDEWRLTKCRR